MCGPVTSKPMKRKIELLAPGGDIASIKAAIVAGADAIYCGLNKLNARNRATNINLEELNGILGLAHKNNCKVFLTLNILILGSDIPELIRLLNKLIKTVKKLHSYDVPEIIALPIIGGNKEYLKWINDSTR